MDGRALASEAAGARRDHRAPPSTINATISLTTKNVNMQFAGDDVLVEQLSTILDDMGTHVTMVCHIFSVADGAITAGIRAYRNDLGLSIG